MYEIKHYPIPVPPYSSLGGGNRERIGLSRFPPLPSELC